MKAYQENVQTSFATCTLAVNEFEDISINLVISHLPYRALGCHR